MPNAKAIASKSGVADSIARDATVDIFWGMLLSRLTANAPSPIPTRACPSAVGITVLTLTEVLDIPF